jgi:hypothetical protein
MRRGEVCGGLRSLPVFSLSQVDIPFTVVSFYTMYAFLTAASAKSTPRESHTFSYISEAGLQIRVMISNQQ